MRLIPAQFVKPYRKSNKNDFMNATQLFAVCALVNLYLLRKKLLLA